MEGAGQARRIKIATYNILNMKDRYVEREPLLKATIRGIGADILSLQEVVYGDSSLDELVGSEAER